MRPVAPPIKKIGLKPSRLNLPIIITETRLPVLFPSYPNAGNQQWDHTRNTQPFPHISPWNRYGKAPKKWPGRTALNTPIITPRSKKLFDTAVGKCEDECFLQCFHGDGIEQYIKFNSDHNGPAVLLIVYAQADQSEKIGRLPLRHRIRCLRKRRHRQRRQGLQSG